MHSGSVIDDACSALAKVDSKSRARTEAEYESFLEDPDFVEIFCCASDAGSDISGGREIAQKQITPLPWKMWFDVDCFAHQYHIMTKLHRLRQPTSRPF